MRLPSAPFAVFITPSAMAADRLLVCIEAACAGGVSMVQLRRPGSDGGPLLELAIAARTITRASGVLLMVNDRVDVAVAAEADGVHLPAAGLSPEDARSLRTPPMLVGISVHSTTEIRALQPGAVDLVQYGTVFPTPSKAGLSTQGLAPLAEAKQASTKIGAKLVAVGGLDASNCAATIRAGADGVAVIRAVSEAANPRDAAQVLVSALSDG